MHNVYALEKEKEKKIWATFWFLMSKLIGFNFQNCHSIFVMSLSEEISGRLDCLQTFHITRKLNRLSNDAKYEWWSIKIFQFFFEEFILQLPEHGWWWWAYMLMASHQKSKIFLPPTPGSRALGIPSSEQYLPETSFWKEEIAKRRKKTSGDKSLFMKFLAKLCSQKFMILWSLEWFDWPMMAEVAQGQKLKSEVHGLQFWIAMEVWLQNVKLQFTITKFTYNWHVMSMSFIELHVWLYLDQILPLFAHVCLSLSLRKSA